MPTWKCIYFASKDSDIHFWGGPVENCGLCINWCDGECIHHEQLKVQGENEGYEENSDDYGFSRVNTEYDEWSGYGKPN